MLEVSDKASPVRDSSYLASLFDRKMIPNMHYTFSCTILSCVTSTRASPLNVAIKVRGSCPSRRLQSEAWGDSHAELIRGPTLSEDVQMTCLLREASPPRVSARL